MSASASLRLPRRTVRQPLYRTGTAVALCLLLAIGPAALAAVGPMDFVLLGQPKVAGQATQMSWRMGEYSAWRLVEVEPGAGPNDHPQGLPAERLRAALATVTIGDGQETLFDRDEAEQLAATLQQVLKAAKPDQDLLLMSSARRGRGLLTPQLTVTARLFVRDGHLHLLVHDDRLDVVAPYRQTRTMPMLAFGSRAQASEVRLRADGRAGPRSDWLSWPLAALQPGASTAPAAASDTTAPPTLAAPAAAPGPVPAPPAAPGGGRSAEERLRVLKRLHEQGLISDDELARKRRQILAEL